ncbi:hypothetical protein Taro_038428 [Colocasia esculenta]|uniref:Uncharacterized protein n=1 Tax=Colocasia esculenta TaxID=4460 RepID=A0A843WFU8_COLES|nr:hypothetical protein [Colocasia esculenta]
MGDERLCVTILNWGLISDSDNQAERYAHLSEGVSVCDRIGSLRPRSRRGENNMKWVTISAMFVHPYLRPGEEFSRRVEHNFRSS